MTQDPFPRARLTETLRHIPAYLRLSAALAMDPALAKKRRAALLAAAGYLVSPVDLIPGIIPVVGQLDDLALALAALRLALAGLDPERRARPRPAEGRDRVGEGGEDGAGGRLDVAAGGGERPLEMVPLGLAHRPDRAVGRGRRQGRRAR